MTNVRLSYTIIAVLLIAAAILFVTHGFPPSGVR
jgi:hypothetical protein